MAGSRSILSLVLLAVFLLLATVTVSVLAQEDFEVIVEQQVVEEEHDEAPEVEVEENLAYSSSWVRDPELPPPSRGGRVYAMDPVFDPRNVREFPLRSCAWRVRSTRPCTHSRSYVDRPLIRTTRPSSKSASNAASRREICTPTASTFVLMTSACRRSLRNSYVPTE